jgi:hypothetical protein
LVAALTFIWLSSAIVLKLVKKVKKVDFIWPAKPPKRPTGWSMAVNWGKDGALKWQVTRLMA